MSKSSESDETTPESKQSDRRTKLKCRNFGAPAETSGEHEQNDLEERQDHRREACNPYEGVEEVAERLVENIIAHAISERTKSSKSASKEPTEKQDDDDDMTLASTSTRTFTECVNGSDPWPSIRDFTVKAGMEAIEDYMSKWYYDEDWVYNIELILAQSDECSDFYIYEVKWGVPTRSYPIAQATASVFFTLDVSRVKPPECPVDVTYQFEGCSYKHAPFGHAFKEEWLFRIIEAKLRFFRSLKF